MQLEQGMIVLSSRTFGKAHCVCGVLRTVISGSATAGLFLSLKMITGGKCPAFGTGIVTNWWTDERHISDEIWKGG